MLIFTLPHINPNIIQIGIFQIRWYSLAYILGIILGWLTILYFNKKDKIFDKTKFSDDFFVYAILGMIIGGRLGYVLFYNFSYYLSNPLEIFAVWRGGMSFHGGLLGCTVSAYLITKKYNVDLLKFADLCSVAAPIGLFLGRIANFVNMELYGKTTEVPWGIVFPNAGDLPRHPSQLYEAFLEGAVLFVLLFCLANFTKIRKKKGCLTGLFFIFYSLSRIFIEFFREPDIQVGYIFNSVTMGQILSVPILIFGIYLLLRNKKVVAS